MPSGRANGGRQIANAFRKVWSISGIGIEPMTRSTAAIATVATLSAITTESPSRPDCRPAADAMAIPTRLGCPARNMRLLIIATMTWATPVSKSSAYTTRAGRVFAVWRSECGNKTRTTSPRLQEGFGRIVVVIRSHLGAVPVLGKPLQPAPQFRGCNGIDATGSEVDRYPIHLR